MADASPQDPFVQRALVEIEGWAGTLGSEVVVESVGAAIRRVKLHGPDSPQVLFLRLTPTATYLEPYFNEPTNDEVAALKAGFSDAEGSRPRPGSLQSGQLQAPSIGSTGRPR